MDSSSVNKNTGMTFGSVAFTGLMALVWLVAGGLLGGALCFVAHGNSLLFAGVVLLLLIADQLTIHKNHHEIGYREAFLQSIFWIALGLGFGAYMYYLNGHQKGIEFFTGYLIEKALSVDNLFVFIFIFGFFKVPVAERQTVLFWGIIGAKIMRFALIAAGAALVNIVHLPLLYVLGAVVPLVWMWFGSKPEKFIYRILIAVPLSCAIAYGMSFAFDSYLPHLGFLAHEANVVLMFFGMVLLGAAYKLYGADADDGVEPEKNSVVQFVRGHIPVSKNYEGGKFWTWAVQDNKGSKNYGKLVWMLTPLAIVLISIEVTDLMFATDSIPAIFAVSKDPFILYSSNVCAILGLRALYFLLEKSMRELDYLKKALVFVLGFIGVKLVIDPLFHFPITWALVIVGVLIAGGIALSFIIKKEEKEEEKEEGAEEKK